MKLSSIHSRGETALNECATHIRLTLREMTGGVINESADSTIIDNIRRNLINRVAKYSKFGQLPWVEDLVNGLKQAGVHGINEIAVDDRPVTVAEVKQLVGLIIDILRIK